MQSEDLEGEWRCWGPHFLQATVLLRPVHDTGGFEGRAGVRASVAETLSRYHPSGSFSGGPVEGMVANQDCTIFGTRISPVELRRYWNLRGNQRVPENSNGKRPRITQKRPTPFTAIRIYTTMARL